jgi:Xaa-Pro dipeptidase
MDRASTLDFDGMQALLLVAPANITYLSGFRATPYERLIALVATPDGELRLVVPSLEEDAARAAVDGAVACLTWRDEDGPADALREALAGVTGTLGVEYRYLTLAQHELVRRNAPGLDIVDGEHVVARARLCKRPEELVALRRAAEILDDAFAKLADEALVPGRTELEVSTDCARFIREGGGTTGSFEPIVLTGPRSALPHGRPGATELQVGDLLIADFGAIVDGYYSDATRTFVVGREPDDRQRELLGVVQAAERAGIDAARTDAEARDVDRAARTVIEDAGYGEYFVHRTGHGLGLEVHEPPWLTSANPEPLRTDMVVTIEPGIYIPDYGGVRIEDDVRIDDPPEVMTQAASW